MAKRPKAPRQIALGIECATMVRSVALVDVSQGIMAERMLVRKGSAAPALLAEVEAMMSEFGIGSGEMVAVGVSMGPGSFTGTRTGLTLAKTLAHGWSVGLYPMNTLEGMARRWPLPGAAVMTLLDARRHEVYGALYRWGAEGALTILVEPQVAPVSQFLDEVIGCGCDAIWGTGDGVKVHRDTLSEVLGTRVCPVPEHCQGPGAQVLALAAAEAFAAGQPGENPLAVSPLYLRPSDAELNLAKRS